MSLLNDSLFIVMILFGFMLVAGILGYTINEFNTHIQGEDVSSRAKTDIAALDNSWGGAMDWLFLALLIGLPLASMGLAYFNAVPSVFFYMTLAVLLLMVFVGWGLQDGYTELQGTGGALAGYIQAEMPITNFIMTNFGIYSLLVVLIIGYGTYVKSTRTQGGYM